MADKNFKLLKHDPSHPSLQFKLLGGGKLYSTRVGLHYRALGLPRESGVH